MKILVAMSGGVDSSVAAAMLQTQGHDIDGATLRLWGGESDSGCCSVSDVDDARRVCQQLGINHYVFNFSDEFDEHVVDPYVAAHQNGLTPNPCVECNRHVKFDLFAKRAWRMGYDMIATGHHVRRVESPDGGYLLARAVDERKDQSYVVHMISPDVLDRCLFPVGETSKDKVREMARGLDLRTADKPESMDVCFIAKTGGGRRVFLGNRIEFRPAKIVDMQGKQVGESDALELVTIGQRSGLGQLGVPERRYVTAIDSQSGTVTVGTQDDLMTSELRINQYVGRALTAEPVELLAQTSAHGVPFSVLVNADVDGSITVNFVVPSRKTANGQSVVLYDGELVYGGGVVIA